MKDLNDELFKMAQLNISILQELQSNSKSALELNSEKSRTRVIQKIVCICIFLFSLKPELQVLEFQFVRLS